MNNKNGYFIHVDGCGEIINELGVCPRCNFHPASEDTVFIEGKLPRAQENNPFITKKLRNSREVKQLSHSLALIEIIKITNDALGESLKKTILYRYFLAEKLTPSISQIYEEIYNQIYDLTNNPTTKDS